MTHILDQFIKLFRLRRISVRLGLSYVVILSFFLLVIGISVSRIQGIVKKNETEERRDMERLLSVQSLSIAIQGSGSSLLSLLLTDDSNRKKEYRTADANYQQISDLMNHLRSTMNEDLNASTLARLNDYYTRYRDSFLMIVNYVELEDKVAAQETLSNHLEPTVRLLLKEAELLLKQEQDRIVLRQNEAQAELKQVSITVTLISTLSIILSLILALITARSIIRPLREMEVAALKIATGEYDTIGNTSKAEELVRVSNALNKMSEAIAAREFEIEQLAFYDPLTKLANRTKLMQDFQDQTLTNLTFILMDVARLKSVNETLGFNVGDHVILETAKRIQHAVSSSSNSFTHLLKFNGGMFAILISEASHETVEQLVSNIDLNLSEPVQCKTHSIDINLIYGISVSNEKTPSLVELIRNAEVALYSAKSNRQHSVWHNHKQEESRLEHLSLLSDLRSAVKDNQLQMWLQPKATLNDMKVYGFEALIRWQHPKRGFISPAEFVPFAERTGYIGHITQWIVVQALMQLNAWKTSHPDLSIAINITMHDLRDPQFPARIKDLLQEYQVPAHLIKFELTESGVMDDPASTIPLLQNLVDIGIKLSIDDFGTGYSSLAYLQRLPVSELKIDRSFVIDIDQHSSTQNLVASIIAMSKSLNLSVIAEGIETQAERDVLRNLGCESMQGYFFSKPLHGEQLEKWLQIAELDSITS
jgi:diguanylate cyclase (GGDEF)-like protein